MLIINELSFSYNKNTIFENVNLNIAPGKCVGLLGANGSGKSTLLSVIAGIRKPLHGQIINEQKLVIGLIPQENPLMPDLSGYDNLLLWYKGSKKSFDAMLNDPLIKNLGINDFINKPIKKLSGGMKKKISIAAAMLNHPDILLLDEPSAALDIPSKLEIHDYLKNYVSAGHSVILTTHDEIELDICDELYVLHDSKLININNDCRGGELLKYLK